MEYEKLTRSLKNEVLTKLISATGKKFKALKMLGNGASSIAILVEDEQGEKVVYKCDKKLYSFIERFKARLYEQHSQKSSIDAPSIPTQLDYLSDKLRAKDDFIKTLQNKCRMSSCPIFIPSTTRYSNFTLEEYAGEPASIDLLTGETSVHLAKNLAHFYLQLHKGKKYPIIFEPIAHKICTPIPAILDKYKDALTDEAVLLIKNSYKSLLSMDSSDEVLTTIHGDFRRANLCFNSQTNQLAVIDWEFARQDNIYSEFVAKAITSQHIPFSFIEKVIDEYNLFSDAKINKDKLKNLYIVGIVQEYGSYALANKCTYDEFFDYYSPKILGQLSNFMDFQLCENEQ